ncbi:MAG: lytic transglycosylase domain-containing protein [Rhodovibrionaceae bacterium]
MAANPQISPADRALYERALQLVDANALEDAHDLARRGGEPLLTKYLTWLYLSQPSLNGDFQEIASFLRANPHWPRQNTLRNHAEIAMPPDLPGSEVLAWFDSYPPVSHVGMIRYGQALQRLGRLEQAIPQIRETWVEGNLTATEEAEYRNLFAGHLRPEDELERFERLVWEGRKGPAKRQATRLGNGYPELAEARLRLAYREDGVDSAINRVPARLQDDPGLIYERARWRMRKDRYESALELLDPPLTGVRHADEWWDLRYWVARYAFRVGDFSVAYRLASQHGLDGGGGFAEGEWFAGWLALRFLQQPEAAYRHFQTLYEGVSFPISLSRAAYWAGEAANAIGNPDWARRWYTLAAHHVTTYYGQLAAARLGQPPMTLYPTDTYAEPADKSAFERQELVQAARLLHAVGGNDRIGPLITQLRLQATKVDEVRLASELAQELERPDLAVHAAKQASYDGMVLPQQLYPDVDFYAGHADDADLVLAVIRQESVFYERAISPAGAHGLMQLMPATAKGMSKRLGLTYDRDRLLDEPDYNVQLGRAYLRELMAEFDGYYPLVLVAYNAGPSRAREWIRLFGDPRKGEVDPVDWVESIPFSETRNYVQRVIEGAVIYRQRYAPNSATLPVKPIPRGPEFCCETAQSWPNAAN